MRIIGVMLVLAAALFWASWRLQSDGLVGAADVVAVRAGPRTAPARPDGKSSQGSPAAKSPDALLAVAPPPTPPSLFRIAAAPMKPPPPPPKPGEHFTLTGVVLAGGRQAAFLRDQVDGRTWSAGQGGLVGSWRVTSIDPRCVALERKRSRQRLCL